MAARIEFYDLDKPYGFFSNFSKHPVFLKGVIWPTTEHYFQAQKYAWKAREEAIRLAPTAREAAKMGQDHHYPLVENWDSIKEDVMRTAVYAKFTQHPDLHRKLLETGDAILVEHSKKDTYWADGGDGSGKNRLGQILMEIRALLQAQA